MKALAARNKKKYIPCPIRTVEGWRRRFPSNDESICIYVMLGARMHSQCNIVHPSPETTNDQARDFWSSGPKRLPSFFSGPMQLAGLFRKRRDGEWKYDFEVTRIHQPMSPKDLANALKHAWPQAHHIGPAHRQKPATCKFGNSRKYYSYLTIKLSSLWKWLTINSFPYPERSWPIVQEIDDCIQFKAVTPTWISTMVVLLPCFEISDLFLIFVRHNVHFIF